MVRCSPLIKKALDCRNEITKLVKFSLRRDVLFEKTKRELAPQSPGMRVLCPTRWTVRADALSSVLINYSVPSQPRTQYRKSAMFHLQPTGTCGASMSSGKRPRGACQGPQVPQPAIGPEIGSTVVVAAVRSSATTTVGIIGGVQVEMMLDSGSSISLVRSDILSQTNITRIQAPRQIQLRTASGAELPIVDHGRMQVTLGELNLWHDFAIVDSLVVPVILGVDFLQEKELVLDFTQRPVGICLAKSSPQMDTLQVPMYSEERKMQAKACAITVLDKPDSDVVNECAVPKYAATYCRETTIFHAVSFPSHT